MNVLAELACARVPTSTLPKSLPLREKSVKSPPRTQNSTALPAISKDAPKKPRNPIKELFERKKELADRKHAAEIQSADSKKSKKPKRHQDFPLIRKSQLDAGLVERKKRRENPEKSKSVEKIKDVYDFDEDESQPEVPAPALSSYRAKNEKEKDVSLDMSDLMTKTIGETLKNGKTGDALGTRLESMVNRKFQEIETFVPKTKGALKSFHVEAKESRVVSTGPMDEFVERKQRPRKIPESSTKHGRSKRRNKNSKKKSRWYENDSSDEFVTAAKAEDIGVGITKSQRTCSKGKQNLFAELSSTSSESEEDENEKSSKLTPKECEKQPVVTDWIDAVAKETKKSESELSDHPLVIDERKIESDEIRNSDEDTENNFNAFELDDLYREDTSVAESDVDDEDELKVNGDKELIPLEEALDILDKEQLNEVLKPEITKTKPEPIKENITDCDASELPEKLTTEKKPSENLPLHVFLSRKVQESKKRKQEKKLQEEKEALMASEVLQPTRRERKCAIGKQGLLAELSSSDEDFYLGEVTRKSVSEKSDGGHERTRKPKRESKEKRKERYMEKKHEQMIAKEQKAIEEDILRELGKTKSLKSDEEEVVEKKTVVKKKPGRTKKSTKTPEVKNAGNAGGKKSEKVKGKETKERNGKRDDEDDEELRTTKCWNKVEEGVGVAIGRRKRAAANQLYYWSSSSDEDEEPLAPVVQPVEEEDDRQEQHGWIVGDSHKRMITMLAMEKQLKEKRRRSEDEFEPGKTKGKKHRNSTS